MSEETDRTAAIEAGGEAIYLRANVYSRSTARVAATALLDAGWIPPKQRNEELAQISGWMADARRAFERIEAIAADLDVAAPNGSILAARLREALGERFLTPKGKQQ